MRGHGQFSARPLSVRADATWHYGKDVPTLKQQFVAYIFREEIFGAYLGDEFVGFMMLADAGDYAVLGQIVSKLAYRDKAPNNASAG